MRSNIETMVLVYVRSKNRRALEEMRELRTKLLEDLRFSSNPSREALDMIHDDLRAIEEGLKQL